MKTGEFELIERLKRFQRRSARIITGIGDDAAVLRTSSGKLQLVTTDMLVEGVHFTPETLKTAVGYKAMAVNISDIAAMGGVPTFAVVSIGITSGLGVAAVEKIYGGMAACADKFGVSMVGGDTVRSDRLVINVALLGEVDRKQLVLRSGARPGDRILVTGPLGGSLASGRHLRPVPRVKEARFLVTTFKPSAMIDVSDGLAGDLGHILKESRVGATIDEGKVPLNRGVTFEHALRDGEDFELVFTLSSEKSRKLIQYLQSRRSFRFFDIGEIIGSPGKLFVRNRSGLRRAVEPKGYEHF